MCGGGEKENKQQATVIRIASPSTRTHTGTLHGLVEFQHHGTVDSSKRADDLTSAARGCLVRHRGRSQAAPTSPSGSLPCGFTCNHEESGGGDGGGGGIVPAERVGEEREGGEGREPIAGRRPVEGREESRRSTQRGGKEEMEDR